MTRQRHHISLPQSPLPCAPSPSTGEGLLGYRLRLTDLNRFPSSTWIYDGPVGKTVLGGYENLGPSEPLDQLSALTSLGRTELARELLFPKGLYIRSVNLTLARVCPDCLIESPYLRKVWDLSLFVACPQHGVYLLDRCPACNTELTWNRPHVTICPCGFDYREAKTTIAEAPVISLMSHIGAAAEEIGTTEYGRQPSLGLSDSFPDLDLPLDELCTLIMFLGGLSIHRSRRKTFMQPQMIAMTHAITLVRHTASLLQRWPMSFKEILDKRQSSRKSAEYAGLRERFGYMYIYLYNHMTSSHFDFLRRLFEEYVRDNFVGHLESKHFSKFVSGARLRSRYVTAAAAAKELKISVSDVRQLLNARSLPGVMKRDKSGRYEAFVERQALSTFIPESRDIIRLSDVMKIFGLTKKRARELMKSKYLKTIFGCSKGNHTWRISKSRVLQVLTVICGDLPEIAPPLPVGQKTLRNLLRSYVTEHGHFPLVLYAMLKKEIVPIGRRKGIAGINGLVFSLEDVLKVLKAKCGLAAYRSVDESAAFLKLDRYYVYKLIDAGFLKTFVAPIGFRGLSYIPSKKLRIFKARYITTPEFMRLTGTHRAAVPGRLLRLGVKPVRAAHCVRGGMKVYERRAVLKHLGEFQRAL